MKKRTVFSLLLCLSLGLASAQQVTEKEARKWVKSAVWSEGFIARPYSQINDIEFYQQYKKNPERWKKMFAWLQANDIDLLVPGRYYIDGEHCFANVQDATLGTVEEQKIESHKNYIDLQYSATGIERFGLVLKPEEATIREPYKTDIMFWNYKDTKFEDGSVKKFFLFFPSDYHQACLYPTGKKSPTDKKKAAADKIRKVCVKMEYVQ